MRAADEQLAISGFDFADMMKRGEVVLKNNIATLHIAGPARPGNALKDILAGWPFYIASSPNCPCNARADEMDRRGIEWCEANIDTIVGWLREQATARGLPFLDIAGRLLVRRAIANARRNA